MRDLTSQRAYPFSTCLFPDGALTTNIHNKGM
ncbi:protein of unknown function (plasmid) [Paraburkholderia dioscoreae]|uniref:Uncharacterized protein n=1 Tax=Paraburkholderia dioscoreae TaxID=2604047 RepID=A0A5Q4ZID0_9BURK|nr:protein of unknown function [Paraburkholderia dioscoreae]